MNRQSLKNTNNAFEETSVTSNRYYNYSGYGDPVDILDDYDEISDSKTPYVDDAECSNNDIYAGNNLQSSNEDISQLSVGQKQEYKINIYLELLKSLKIDENIMQIILRAISRQCNSNFSFISSSNNFKLLYFTDEQQHIFPVSLEKIIIARDLIIQLKRQGL